MAAQLFAAGWPAHNIAVFEVRPGIIETDMTAPTRARTTKRIADGRSGA